MIIPLAIAFTGNYYVPAATLLRSVLKSSPHGRFRVLCLLTEDLSDAMKEGLQRMGGERMEFEYVNLRGRLEGVYTDPRYTEAASFRLLLPELLPELDTVLYLDCDIIARKDMSELFRTTDLGDNYLAAVYEAPIEDQASRITELGCSPQSYFNSGVLIMNLRKMREDGVSSKLLDACRKDYMEFPDQDALNVVCQGKVLPLSPLYNGIRTFYIPKYMKEFSDMYSDYLWYEVDSHANIHYTGGKPWDGFTVKFAQWWKTYESLPDDIKAQWTVNKKMWRLWQVYKTKVGRAVIDFARNVYRRIKP